ncbi:ATP-binding protein [Wukongibacter baidiensis]|uniref:ATP-binding protein n=1 Tax=Wukongibacter baidiensis TaxID=1723361 RepID=UPI003D7FE2A5
MIKLKVDFQEDMSRNSANSGIGLYVVKQIIEKHGENIYLTRDPDYKTIFEISFNKNRDLSISP